MLSASTNPLDSSHGAEMHIKMSFTLQTSSAAAYNPAVLTALRSVSLSTAAGPLLMSPARSPDRLTNFRRAANRHGVGTEEFFEYILGPLPSSLSVPEARFCAQPSFRWEPICHAKEARALLLDNGRTLHGLATGLRAPHDLLWLLTFLVFPSFT